MSALASTVGGSQRRYAFSDNGLDSQALGVRMRYFCTYFDSNYLSKGLALYKSLAQHARPFRLWVLCLDRVALDVVLKLDLDAVVPISLEDLEKADSALLLAKRNRSQIEYYFTCTPSLLLYVSSQCPEGEVLTYLDADLFFYSDPSALFEELDQGSVLIIEHRFSPHLRHRLVYGIYNVGLLAFRRDNGGLACLEWCRDRCLEWCYDRLEDGRFADQKYLDDWPTRFPGVVVLQHQGAGVAPWNVSNYSLRSVDGVIMVDSQPLVFYHFHGLNRIGRWLLEPGLGRYAVDAGPILKDAVYGPYVQSLQEAARQGSAVAGRAGTKGGSIRRGGSNRTNILRRIAVEAISRVRIAWGLLRGHIWVVIGGRVVWP